MIAMYSSYQLKWAVEDKLKNTDVDSVGLGPSISLVMEHESIRDKFLSVSGDLSRMGYSAVRGLAAKDGARRKSCASQWLHDGDTYRVVRSACVLQWSGGCVATTTCVTIALGTR